MDLYLNPTGEENMRLVVDSISRAVWRQDRKLPKKLLKWSPTAALHIRFVFGKIRLVDPLLSRPFFWKLEVSNELMRWLR